MTGEDGSNHTAQVGPGDGGKKESKKRNEFNLYFSSRNELARPVMGTIFLVILVLSFFNYTLARKS